MPEKDSNTARQLRPKAVRFAEAARYCGLCENHLRNEVARGRLAVVRIGRATRLLLDDLDQYLLSHRLESIGGDER
jgi:excisionase family DNA binding protein